MKIKSYIVSLIVVAIIAISGAPIANAAYLTVGSRGGEVVDLQVELIEAGFDIPAISSGLASPGYFGSQTRNAVSEYQRSKGLSVTGSVSGSLKDENQSVKLGAVSGPDFYGPYQALNDVKEFKFRSLMKTATSTPCSYYIAATSTLNYFNVNVSSSTSVTATAYTLATSTSAYATSSLISYFGLATTTTPLSVANATTTIPSAGYGTLTYSLGQNSSGQQGLLSANSYVVLGVQGGNGNFGTAAQVGGSCQIKYTQI